MFDCFLESPTTVTLSSHDKKESIWAFDTVKEQKGEGISRPKSVRLTPLIANEQNGCLNIILLLNSAW